MGNDINQQLERIIALYDSGGNPNTIMQQMFGKNPQINQLGTQYMNMKQGMSDKDFCMQLARQAGINDKNLQGLARILGVKI